MQDIAVEHYAAMGGTTRTQALGATWVVREHKIVYLRPAFAGDEIEVQTWVENLRRVRSMRKYRFVRTSDQALLVQGETDWVFVDAETGRPRRIADEIAGLFSLTTGAS
jgi:acyl-CoA thioester hydrolase